nr:hypothetical protein [Exiguobacterium indicum]
MSFLNPISGCSNSSRKADVVFIHGLGGDASETWRQGKNTETFWPKWIGDEFPQIGVWSLSYAASPTKFKRIIGFKRNRDSGYAMSLPDRARQVLDLMVQNGFGKRPIMFIGHSLGGLLIKQILRTASDSAKYSLERNVFENTRAVLFLGTPHHGAKLASLLSKFKLAFPSISVQDLVEHDAHLRDLFEWYRVHGALKIETWTYYESRGIHGAITIVNPSSANPGIGRTPVPLDEDHVSIAKPTNQSSQVYSAVKELIKNHVLTSTIDSVYQRDIEVISEMSSNLFIDLSDLSRLRVGNSEIKINRKLSHNLYNVVEDNSLMIVGNPGAGKSAILHDLVSKFTKEKRDVVFLAVDRIDAESHSQLREQLGIENNLEDILKHWEGSNSGFLVIDALDAARSNKTAQILKEMLKRIVRTNGRWKVIASIRKFDLRHSRELREIFYGQPPFDDYKDLELRNVCHVQIPVFSEEELEEVTVRSSEMLTLINNADGKLKELLKIPFNLRLVGELVGNGMSIKELTPVRTQVELFDQYWEERVVQPHDGKRDERENLLRQAVSLMVKNRKLLVSRTSVAKVESSLALDQLLSGHVLTEWQPAPNSRSDNSNLTFGHHMFFDYAVERMLLREGDSLSKILSSEPELVLVIRPSLDIHFQHIWTLDTSRELFWETCMRVVENSNIPEVGKIIGPMISVKSIVHSSDLTPLLRSIKEPSHKSSAEIVIRHIVTGLSAISSDNSTHNIFANTASVWANFTKNLSQNLSQNRASIVNILLSQLCENLIYFINKNEMEQVGVSARNLLDFAWSEKSRNEFMINKSISYVCHTYNSDIGNSQKLLMHILEKEHLEKYGFREIPALAHEIGNLIDHDPCFVKNVYISAFGYIENSKEDTPLGGRIMSFISNRKQDYNIGLYRLEKSFEKFMEIAPIQAIEALISIVKCHVLTKSIQLEHSKKEDIIFEGIRATIYNDNSFIWDSDFKHHKDEILKMMDIFQKYFISIGMDDKHSILRNEIINVFVKQNQMAALWRRILICGTKAPNFLGLELKSLSWSLPILINENTSYLAGEYLKSIFHLLSQSDREKVELAILSIPEHINPSFVEQGKRKRDSLLSCLSINYICTPEATNRITELNAKGEVIENKPSFQMGNYESKEYTTIEYLADQGVPVDDVKNRKIQDLEKPLTIFCKDSQNEIPTLNKIQEILPRLRILRKALSTAEADGVHPKQVEYALGSLVEASVYITECADFFNDKESVLFLTSIFFEASQHPVPKSDLSSNHQFNKMPSWSKPAPRIDAAHGLMNLVRRKSNVSSEFLEILKILLKDPVPAVRFQIAIRLTHLENVDHKIMWNLIEDIVMEESSSGVLDGVIKMVLDPLSIKYPDKVAELVKQIYKQPSQNLTVRESCVNISKNLFLRNDHFDSGEIIQEVIGNPIDNANECHCFVTGLRNILKIDLSESTNTKISFARIRAWEILLQTLEGVKQNSDILKEISKEQGGWSEELTNKFKDLAKIVEAASLEIYFSSGAFNSQRNSKTANFISPDIDKRKTFFLEADEVINILADFSFADVTHRLLETLEFLIPVNPAEIFLRIGRTVLVGQNGGYQYEPMGADLIVTLVKRYLAEHQGIFKDNRECQHMLLKLLDIFVQAGWPSAISLTYSMDEIFR